jgi:hypothetical protein
MCRNPGERSSPAWKSARPVPSGPTIIAGTPRHSCSNTGASPSSRRYQATEAAWSETPNAT